MLTLLLVIIYISFISLGLPDPLLGSAWPAIHGDLGIPMAFAGVASMIVSCGTVVSSLLSVRVIKRFGTGLTTAVSVAMTAGALLGFSAAPSFFWLCLLAVPLGLGAGAVDAALNNFVALHYKARHMSWLHCFWGIGATAGPAVMALCISGSGGWRTGYRTIGILQVVLVAVLVLSLPLWKKAVAAPGEEAEEETKTLSLCRVFRVPGAKPVLLGFLCYCAVETTTNLWASSYAVSCGTDSATAAGWSSLFFLGITLGRLASGFLSIKWSSPAMIRLGQGLALLGVVLLALPLSLWRVPVALCLLGTGCAPIYPSMLHQTPQVFGKGLSQAMMGIQMACAYIGSTFMPPLFGALAGAAGVKLLPFFLLFFLAAMIFASEATGKRLSGVKKAV